MKNDICEGDNRATRAASRRLRIVETARRLFVTKGFHGTGVAQIAAESGVKIGQLYRDFACKEDIVAQIVQQSIGEFLDESGLCKAASKRDAKAAHDWLRRFLTDEDHPNRENIDSECAMFAEINAEASRNERIAAILRATDAHVRNTIDTALEIMAPGPTLKERRYLLAHLILSVGHGIWLRRIAAPELPTSVLGSYSLQMIDREIEELAITAKNRSILIT
ncbi:MAG: TetR/AcrR family transcriptional regulator [Novosphingobium sp.]|nr:TetR/AcrR family transcriptional regulator [Novosphingobium sp.]